MTNDESPVDAVPNTLGTLPADEAPRADSAAETATLSESTAPAKTSRRRPAGATQTPRPSRSRRSDTNPPEVPTAAPTTAVAETVAPPQAEAETPLELTPPEAATVIPARTRRPATRRGKSIPEFQPAETPPEAAPVVEPSAAEAIADIGTIPRATESAVPVEVVPPLAEAIPAEKPGRRRRAPRKPVEESVAAPLEAVAPAPEEAQAIEIAQAAGAPAVEAKRPSRRGGRGGRGRRGRGEPAQPAAAADETATPTEEAGAPEIRAELPMPEEPVAKPARGRRPARKIAEPAEDLSRSGARLVTRRGFVELQIDGETVPPILFFGSVEGPKEQRKVAGEVQRAASHGVHIYSTLVELTCPLPPDDTVYEAMDSRIETLIDADPKGFVIPRLVFVPAHGWRKQYPNEVNHYADGSTDDPSIASDLFWREAEHALTQLIEHVQRMGYSKKVIGYHLERGEWFHPADGGYDRSYANREAFRHWLRTKYKNSEPALRAAWYDGQVQFYTVEIPPLPSAPRSEVMFFEPRKERRWLDFLEYTSEVTANRLIELAKVVKEASGGRALTSVCYGYTYEFGHTYSGHLALGKLLAAPSIDILAGPPSYRDRLPGGAGSYPSPVDSMNVHGKLWISEDDTKTFLAPANESPDDFNPRIDSRGGTEHVHQRAIGKALAHQTGIAWMDTWGEGWLDSEDLWRGIGSFTGRYAEFIKHRRIWSPEVAVLVDERSLIHVQKGDGFLRKLLHDQREMILRSGASVGFYLQSDLTARAFPTEAKLYVFLTPYRLPADQRAAIKEKLQRGGKTLVFLYAAGVCDDRGEPEEGAHEVLGITLRRQSWNMEVGSRISDTRHPITDHIQNRNFGVRERLNPSFYVDEEARDVTILAEYQQSGLPSTAVRQMADYRIVFHGEPIMSPEIFRGLCRYAGVHLYTRGGDDYVFAGDGWLTIHATRDGNREIHLPRNASLYDLEASRIAADGTQSFSTFLKAKLTYRFYVGALEEMRKLGLPGAEKSKPARRGRGAKIAAAPPESVTEPIDSTQSAALAGSDLLPLDLFRESPNGAGEGPDLDELDAEQSIEGTEGIGDENGPAAVESAANGDEQKRRRRRRGGRGRGRRHGPGGGAGAATATE